MLKLSSPYLIAVEAAGFIELRGAKSLFVATSYVSGKDLRSALAEPLSQNQVLTLLQNMATAIEDLWRLRIVHRDVKPANIMWTNTGNFVLIDLGLARHLALEELTTLGKTWGTRGYMSPEQSRARRQLTCKSDIFSLGVVTLEALLAKHPWFHDQAALTEGYAVPRVLSEAGLHPDLLDLLARMGQREPSLRPRPSQVISTCNELWGEQP